LDDRQIVKIKDLTPLSTVSKKSEAKKCKNKRNSQNNVPLKNDGSLDYLNEVLLSL
jgi:hypothetical protein